ncbi:transcriptional regulator [Niastella koreensis]|uniref:Transcriptional regulator, AraC family n=2 Tax=Niastella koreensis TaxID=354356 RepID=G8TRB0_NIAKG|nr:AraC family transcriptional regulator [Niastella koreensis]AEW00032.1 transcriptional regulator, AraC family [Niastella koreensis GR20-10]OQP49658.1 transcriptional regulator [Niastella koreensis]
MQKESLYQPFEIHYSKVDVCPKPAHKHNFFELVYIASGTGVQCINDNQFNYQPGHMFLITPDDCHSFQIGATTELVFIRFNDIYVKSQQQNDPRQVEWTKKLKFILHNASHQPGCILRNPPDKVLVKAMVESLLGEWTNKQLYHHEIISQIVNTIITIVARNIGLAMPNKVTDNTGNTVVQILNYIQENIYDADKLKADIIAGHFGIADGYLSRYFKKHTGESIQQYIINYKLKLVETRLQRSDMRINEIVYELGFTDESHLNRLFKKYKGVTPTAFRKQQQPVAV